MMEDAGFILTSYALTFGGVFLYARYVLRRGKAATDALPDESKPWV
jgi:hypothetical protein